jgi:hypothetical protein
MDLHEFFYAFAKWLKATVGFVMSDSPSVCRGKKNQLPINVFSWNFIRENFSKVFRQNSSPFNIWHEETSILHEDQYTNMISRRILPRMRNVPYTSFLQNKNKKSSVFNIVFEHSAVYEIMYKNMVGADRPQTKKWGMHIACWIPVAKTTQPEYVTVIIFPRNKGCTNALLYHFSLSSPFLSYRKKFYHMWRNYLISKKNKY